MGSPLTIDLESLLSPIAGPVPCGTDPRSDTSPTSLYQTVKDARYSAADAERGLERGFGEESDSTKAEETAKRSWPLIISRGTPLIASAAKDLDVAAWMTEALLRVHSLAGLRDGLLLIDGLIERFWDGVFPLPDEDGLETRLAPIAGLSGGDTEGTLIQPLKLVLLTEGDDPSPIAYWQYEYAANSPSGRRDGAITIADFTKGLQHSSPQFIRDLADDTQACLDAVARLDAALEARCAAEAPSFSRLRETLSGILDGLRSHAPALADIEAGPAAEGPEPPATANAEPQHIAAAPVEGAALDRQGAFRQLEELAGFFRRTEPHSPIAYAIENLVRRGRMTFSELIEELIADGNARREYYVNAGVQPPPGDPKR
jgi:type VI secretion system protein ImpA